MLWHLWKSFTPVLLGWTTSIEPISLCCPRFTVLNKWEIFRPISLSNNIYLIIAKVLANRLRRLLQSHINPLQFAFIPGRQMMDSIVIAEEIIVEWKISDTAGFIWKVDFEKAYDSLDWRFLWNVLKRRKFPTVWIKWMKQCVCTTTFAVLVNGRPQGGGSIHNGVSGRDAR